MRKNVSASATFAIASTAVPSAARAPPGMGVFTSHSPALFGRSGAVCLGSLRPSKPLKALTSMRDSVGDALRTSSLFSTQIVLLAFSTW